LTISLQKQDLDSSWIEKGKQLFGFIPNCDLKYDEASSGLSLRALTKEFKVGKDVISFLRTHKDSDIFKELVYFIFLHGCSSGLLSKPPLETTNLLSCFFTLLRYSFRTAKRDTSIFVTAEKCFRCVLLYLIFLANPNQQYEITFINKEQLDTILLFGCYHAIANTLVQDPRDMNTKDLFNFITRITENISKIMVSGFFLVLKDTIVMIDLGANHTTGTVEFFNSSFDSVKIGDLILKPLASFISRLEWQNISDWLLSNVLEKHKSLFS